MEFKLLVERLARGADTSFTVVAGRNLLFSQARQELYELNDTAAYIWRSLEDGIELEVVVDEMVEQGPDRKLVEAYVQSALREWNRLGIRPATSALPRVMQSQPQLCQGIQLAGLHFRIHYWTTHAHLAAAIFQHLQIVTVGEAQDVLLDVVDRGPEHHLFRDGHWLASCSADELAPVLKAQLLTEVLDGSDYELALHAASLTENERMLLVCGSPGAGKTTLALALANAGFGLAGDDLALLDSAGQVRGVPFPAAVKVGAWKLVAGFRPDVYETPAYRRPDRKRVRYLAPHGLVGAKSRPVGWLVLLQRRRVSEASLRPLAPAEALRGLLEGAFTRQQRLTTTGFAALVAAVKDAKCYCLTYSRLEDAVARLREACR